VALSQTHRKQGAGLEILRKFLENIRCKEEQLSKNVFLSNIIMPIVLKLSTFATSYSVETGTMHCRTLQTNGVGSLKSSTTPWRRASRDVRMSAKVELAKGQAEEPEVRFKVRLTHDVGYKRRQVLWLSPLVSSLLVSSMSAAAPRPAEARSALTDGSTRSAEVAQGAAQGAEADELELLLKYVRQEQDPEIALELWDEIVALDRGTSWRSLTNRGNTRLLLNDWEGALSDFEAALPYLRVQRGGKRAQLPNGDTVAEEDVQEALALDSIGLAKGKLGDWAGALDSFERALGRMGTAGSSDATVPDKTPYEGLKGGAAVIGQRVELHAALASFASGNVTGAVGNLRSIDKGPNPDGYPQFWDARAALAVAYFAAGDRENAEIEWADLCRAHPPPPPSTPKNRLFAGVNMAAQNMLKVWSPPPHRIHY
jgi:tetratricopeptide (TPR) repeat protein